MAGNQDHMQRLRENAIKAAEQERLRIGKTTISSDNAAAYKAARLAEADAKKPKR